MFEKCATCQRRIILGATEFLERKFCNEDCCTRFKSQLADRLIPTEVLAKQIETVFRGPCPQCRKMSTNDFFSSTTVTGMLVAYKINSDFKLCCASCGRANRLAAFMHCLVLGWWSPRAAICNIFILPTNLIAAAFIRQPQVPSELLTQHIKSHIINAMSDDLRRAMRESAAQNADTATA